MGAMDDLESTPAIKPDKNLHLASSALFFFLTYSIRINDGPNYSFVALTAIPNDSPFNPLTPDDELFRQ
jgi:hypothetical protein